MKHYLIYQFITAILTALSGALLYGLYVLTYRFVILFGALSVILICAGAVLFISAVIGACVKALIGAYANSYRIITLVCVTGYIAGIVILPRLDRVFDINGIGSALYIFGALFTALAGVAAAGIWDRMKSIFYRDLEEEK